MPDSSSMTRVIEARGVNKEYPYQGNAVHALRGVDLDVQRGEMVAVVGPSGCGKSSLLNDIARTTGGRYFRATDQRALERVYAEIDRLVKSKVQVRRYVRFTERYLPFLLGAALLLVAEWCFRATRWGRVP